jgi:hypothetical protein
MGWLLRGSEPWAAAKWYLRALRHPSGRLESLKGLVWLLRGKRVSVSPENASANV